MRKASWAAVIVTMICVLSARVFAQQPAPAAATSTSTTPTIDQSLEMKGAFSPEISPDGKRVVYEVSRTNWEDNAFERDLWIVDTATGEGHQLTASKKSSTNAAWSPDGKWIAFLSDRPGQISGTPDGKKQIYLIAADGGEARQLTKVETGVNNLAWSPDSKRIAFSAEDPEPKTMKDRKEKYGEYEVVHADYNMSASMDAGHSYERDGSHFRTDAADKRTDFQRGRIYLVAGRNAYRIQRAARSGFDIG